jgi:hypothetical protein
MRRSLLFVAIAVLAVVILLTVAKNPDQVSNVEPSAPAVEAPAGEGAPSAEAPAAEAPAAETPAAPATEAPAGIAPEVTPSPEQKQ